MYGGRAFMLAMRSSMKHGDNKATSALPKDMWGCSYVRVDVHLQNWPISAGTSCTEEFRHHSEDSFMEASLKY